MKMMSLAYIRKISGILVLVAGLSAGTFAQDKTEAINLFNQGVEQMKANDPNALATFEKVVSICDQIGDSAQDVKAKAVTVIPDLYYKKAYNLLMTDKKVNESLQASKATLAIADKYQDPNVKESTQKLMIQAYTSMAASYGQNKEFDKADQACDSILAINPDHTPTLYNKALMLRGLDNAQKFEETIDLYLSKIQGDQAKIDQANKVARDYFRVAGSKANKDNKLTEAVSLLNKASKYGQDNNLYYQLASVYNKQKKFDLAAVNAQKGLDMDAAANAEGKAKYYYELGTAQAGLGKTSDACQSLTNAMYGPFLAAAKAQKTNLKCQ
jgi:tetratricopeptide (TPR) repeat protein